MGSVGPERTRSLDDPFAERGKHRVRPQNRQIASILIDTSVPWKKRQGKILRYGRGIAWCTASSRSLSTTMYKHPFRDARLDISFHQVIHKLNDAFAKICTVIEAGEFE